MRRQTLLPSALGHLGAMGSRLRPAGTAVVHPSETVRDSTGNGRNGVESGWRMAPSVIYAETRGPTRTARRTAIAPGSWPRQLRSMALRGGATANLVNGEILLM